MSALLSGASARLGRWLELNRCEVPITGLAPPFAGFRIVQLSDFHCSRQVTPAYLTEAVDLALRRLVGQPPTIAEVMELEGSGWDADLEEIRTARRVEDL